MTGQLRFLGKDKHGKERVQAIVYVPGGEHRTKVFRAASRADAERDAHRVFADLHDDIKDAERAKGTVGDVIDRWLKIKEQQLSPTTMKGYRICANKIREKWGRTQISDLTPMDVEDWYAELHAAGMTWATVDHHRAVLRMICRRAVKWRIIPSDPCFGIAIPKADDQGLNLPPNSVMLGLIEQATGDAYVAVRLAAAMGGRRGELVGLRWSDVVGRNLHVRRAIIESGDGIMEKSTKGKRARTVSLDYETMVVLAAHRKGQVDQASQKGHELGKWDDRFILANMDADPTGQTSYTPTWLSHQWQNARGDVSVRLHDVRHWYATRVLEDGRATIAELSEWLGHAQVSTTVNIYTHTSPERRRISGAIMGGILPKARKTKAPSATR